MGDYEDLCNESADELEAAHARIEALTKRVAELEGALGEMLEYGHLGCDHFAPCGTCPKCKARIVALKGGT